MTALVSQRTLLGTGLRQILLKIWGGALECAQYPAAIVEDRRALDGPTVHALSRFAERKGSMRLFNRSIASYIRNLPKVPNYLWYFSRSLFLFKRPLRFIYAYLTLPSVPERVIELRSGLKIHLSGHPHDVITVFVVFIRRDYGVIPFHGSIIDIGANIGVFSLYAAHCGKAERVYAYEPNSESYRCLLENIRSNHLGAVIIPSRLAVTSKGGGTVRFPKQSSVYNAIIEGIGDVDFEEVETTSLSGMLTSIGRVDLLKLDCEGAEYDILMNHDPMVLDRISAIRMEYHQGRIAELDAFLMQAGFYQCHFHPDSEKTGNVWYCKEG